jgi:hypothetical protein
MLLLLLLMMTTSAVLQHRVRQGCNEPWLKHNQLCDATVQSSL